MLPVTLWGDLTAVSTAALSSDSFITAIPEVHEIIWQIFCPFMQKELSGEADVLVCLHRVASRIATSEPFFTEVPCIPTFIAGKDGVFLADRRVFIAHRSSDHCVQRPRLTSSSPVIGI